MRLLVILVSVAVGLAVGIGIAHAFAPDAPLPDNLPNAENAPLVPHQDYPESSCARCHADDPDRPDVNVPITPHPERKMCRQCHMPQRKDAPLFRENDWSK